MFYLHLGLIASTLGLTISIILFALFGSMPAILTVAALSFNWYIMLNFNPIWTELWENWKAKSKK